MPHLLGLELHVLGFSLASVGADRSIEARPIEHHGAVFALANARPWKWSLGTVDGNLMAGMAAEQFFAGLEEALGGSAQAVVSVPSVWAETPRRALLAAPERSAIEVLRLVRETSGLVVGASLADPSLDGVCAVVDLGAHKLEVALAEVGGGMLRVLARESVVGVDGARMDIGQVLPLLDQIGRRLTEEAGLASRDVERVVTSGRRLAMPSIAHGVESIWGVPPELSPAGTIARGAARVAAGLAGVLPPWILDDDLHEPPLAHLRPPLRRSTSSVPSAPPPAAPASGASSIPPASVSEHPSTAPTGGPVAAIPASGAFVGIPSLEAMRALDLLHPVGSSLACPPLVTLLNQFTFLRTLSGTLTLRSRDDVLALPVDRGGVCVSAGERSRTLRLAEWSEGTFTWREERLPAVVTKHRSAMTAFVVAALRMRLRGFDDRALGEACGAKMSQSPSVDHERSARLERLNLPEAEQRAVEHVLDGTRSLETMLGEGYIGRATLHRLVALLDAYGILTWAPPTLATHEDPVVVMSRALAGMQGRNHFVALGVHWSAGPEEIQGAWERLRAQYAPGGPGERHDRATAAAIVVRVDQAWGVLRDERTRVEHRRDSYPGMDEGLLAPLLADRAKALEMRGENRAAAEMSRLKREFTDGPPRRDPHSKE